MVSPVVALQLQLQTNVSQLMAIDKNAWKLAMVNMQAMPEPVESSH